MQLQKAERKKAKIKLALQGPAGSGKTFSALLLAFGLCGSWEKIAVIDTENHSADLYAHLGPYNVLYLGAPFNPEKYVEAIKCCEDSGMDVLIIDSISHEWEGIGGILDIHNNMQGNSFTNWGKLTPRHNAFVQTLLQSSCHIIGTIRSKQDYVLVEKNGKQVPEKVGLKGVTREGMDYEFTIVFDLNMKHFVTASKDRTSLFTGKPEFILSVDTARKILNWCNTGTEAVAIDLQQRINDCKSVGELLKLFEQQINPNDETMASFTKRRSDIEQSLKQNRKSINTKANGQHSNTSSD